MKIFKFKKRIVFTLLLFLFAHKILLAQAIRRNSAPRFNYSFLPYYAKTKMPSLTKIPVVNYFETSTAGKSYRGKMLEPIARDIYKNNFAKNFKSLNATYNNGTNGLDGLFIKFDSRNNIKKVRVIEIKSVNAKLNKINKQMSKKWILSGIDKSIFEKEINLRNLQKKISAGRNPIKKINLKKEFRNLNEERIYLKNTEKNIQNGNYERYLVHIDYFDGKIKVEQQKILKETKFKDVVTAPSKVLSEFSYLDKDASKLNSFQQQIKKTLFEEFDAGLTKMGKTPEERASFMYELRNNPEFTSTKEFRKVEFSQTSKERINKVQNSFKTKSQMRFIKGGIVFLSFASEAKTIYDFVNNKISSADLFFDSAINMLSISSVFIEKLNPCLMPIFLALDVTKNLWNWSHGNITTYKAIINVSATVAGTAAFVLGAKIGSTIGIGLGGGIGGVIGGFVGGGVVAGIAAISVNFIGQKIVNYYEALKKTEVFNLFCIDLQKYIERF